MNIEYQNSIWSEYYECEEVSFNVLKQCDQNTSISAVYINLCNELHIFLYEFIYSFKKRECCCWMNESG